MQDIILNKAKVAFYMFLTIIGGLIFVGSQAWEWKNFIKGEYGAIETKGGSILQFVDKAGKRVALADFAATFPEEREQLTRSKRKMVYGRKFHCQLIQLQKFKQVLKHILNY